MESPEQRRPNVTNTAPIGSIDLAAFDDDGNPYEIHPCLECLPWYAEVVVVEGEILVREWHAVECPGFQQVLNRADDHHG